MTLVTVTPTKKVPPGAMKGFFVNGKQILIANVDGIFYAMDAICSHMGGYLPAGKLEKNIVTCPIHRSRFDVLTGKFLLSESKLMDLDIYEVVIEGDEIRVKI